MNRRGDCFGNQEAARAGHHMAMPRIDQSNIHGENRRSWIHKCKKFFKLNHIPVQQWVKLASLYLDGKAEIWCKGFLYGGENLAS